MDLIFILLFLLLIGALFAGIGIWKLYHMAWPEERNRPATTPSRVQPDGEVQEP